MEAEGASVAATSQDDIQSLVQEYKAFKKENPARAARVPETIKTKAQQIYRMGMPYSNIAEACGISPGAVKQWLGDAADRGRGGNGKGRRVVGASSNREDWVKIRIDGKEIEVAKNNFWELIRSPAFAEA